MARLAGLRLVHRWAGWDRSPFTATSDFARLGLARDARLHAAPTDARSSSA